MSSKINDSIDWFHINVYVKPNKKEVKIYQTFDLTIHTNSFDSYIIELPCLPIENRCNNQIILHLAKYFKTQKNLVKIVHGSKSRHKYLHIGICKK